MIYLKNYFDSYLAQVQGSVGIKIESGEVVHLAFSGSNQKPYVSIGSELVKDGKLTKECAGIPSIRNYFTAHPQDELEYIDRNPRFIFFKKSSDKTFGSAGIELLPEHSVAADQTIFSPGSLLFVKLKIPSLEIPQVKISQSKISQLSSAENLEEKEISRFVLVLDTGSAIQGPKHLDFFLGEGDFAGEVAGRLSSRGEVELIGSPF